MDVEEYCMEESEGRMESNPTGPIKLHKRQDRPL